ncbi:MAG: LPS assembly lipoprotein LptE [Nitrospira sp.]
MIGCGLLGWPALIPAPPTIILGVMGCVGGATVGAISGGIYGAIAAEPEKSAQTVVGSVRDALASARTHERVRDKVRDLIQHRSAAPLANDENEAPVQLETSVLSIQLDGLHPSVYSAYPGMINPSVRLVVTAQARLMSTQKKEELYAARFQYWGPRMTVPEWAKDEAQPVREEIDRATVMLAEQIVDAIFFLSRVP